MVLVECPRPCKPHQIFTPLEEACSEILVICISHKDPDSCVFCVKPPYALRHVPQQTDPHSARSFHRERLMFRGQGFVAASEVRQKYFRFSCFVETLSSHHLGLQSLLSA